MSEGIKENIKEPKTWQRGLYMLLFVICYSVAEVILTAVVIFQFLLTLFTSRTNDRLLKLGQSLSTYIYQIIQFLTFNSDYHPYPFGAWPRGVPKVDKRLPDSEQWTDQNASDSGITLVELFALLTEKLGYRDGVTEVEAKEAFHKLLEIEVDGKSWNRVDSLSSAGPDDEAYVIDISAGEIRFGDGTNGRRPAIGSSISVTYQHGGGVSGNIATEKCVVKAVWDEKEGKWIIIT